MELPQIVHIVFQYIHDAFNGKLIDENTIIVLIFKHTIIVPSAVEINPYLWKCVFVSSQHTTAQHTTPKHGTTHHSTAHHTTTQQTTPQHSTAQHTTPHPHHNNENTLQYSTRRYQQQCTTEECHFDRN